MKLILGDCLEKLKDLPDNSVDSIVTDPPYGLSFMGKKWDCDVPSVEIWRECLRVLKPGGHLLAFSGTRTYHRMAVAIEDAGFEVRDMIEWVYGSGFPKSHNIKKTLEKKYLCQFTENAKNVEMGLKLIQVESSEEKTDSVAVYVGMSQEGEQESLTVTGKVEDSQGQTVMYQFVSTEKIDSNTLLSLKKKLEENYNKENKHITLTELRMIIDLKIYSLLQYQNTLKSIVTTNHTALKPAHEPICMARKPLGEKTVAQNVLKYGTGGINIDECRVGTREREQFAGKKVPKADTGAVCYQDYNYPKSTTPLPEGRFPANFIHDGSEEVRECFPETGKGGFPKLTKEFTGQSNITFRGAEEREERINLDSGNASRFFKSIIYQAKASKKDRNEGLPEGQTSSHPTVKPTKLMQYLVRLVTPKSGVVLDPFMGSGSTGKACKIEGFDFIGIEIDAEYLEIAKARIENAQKYKVN